jgi:hypothetical protein
MKFPETPGRQLYCDLPIHSSSKFPEKIPPEQYLENVCKGLNCPHLQRRKPGVIYPDPPPGTRFYRPVPEKKLLTK